MTSDFTVLSEHLQAVLALATPARERYLDNLPQELSQRLRELLPFEKATFDLSAIPALELALEVLADPVPECIGRWRVQRCLGRGGTATVYLVERSEGAIRQLAACKLGYVRTELEDGLRRETATLLDLAHPGIAPVLDFGHVNGRPYLVSEFVEGADIVSWANGQGLPLPARLALFEEVLSAVAYAHERLLLHQDIKPDNLLVDAGGRPRLIDFGLSAVMCSRGEAPVLGYTPRFASPEQRRGDSLTVRSDIYSLGVTLRVLLEHGGPARGRDDALAVIDRACAEDPALRYASVAEFAADVRAIRESRPVTARARSTAYRLTRFLQRHPLPVTLAGLLVLSLVAGGATTVWQARRAIEAARTSEAALVNARTVEAFLIEDVLGRANPADPAYDAASGIRGVVDSAAAAAERRFARNPLANASIHAALASTQRSLGRYEESAALAERSAELYAAVLGRSHEFTLTSRYLQVRALSAIHVAEAEQVLAAADLLAGDYLAERGRLALAAAIAHALVAQNRLQGSEAVAAYRRVEELRALVAPDDTTLQASAITGMAEAYTRMNQPEQVIRTLEQLALESLSHAQQASAHRQFAHAYRALADLDHSLQHAQRALALYRRSLGDDAYPTLSTWSTLSYTHMLRSECDAALHAGRTAFEGMRRVYGESRQATLIERANYGDKQFECGQRDEGLANTLAAIQGLREHHGADNAALQIFTWGAAEFLIQLQRYGEALGWLEQLTDQTLRGDEVIAVVENLGAHLMEAGDPGSLQRLSALRERAGIGTAAGPDRD